MGWSLDLVIDQIHAIFGKNLHEVSYMEAERPYVRIGYNKEINVQKKRLIAELFPPDIYIHFHPDTIHPEAKDKPALLFPQG